MKTPVLTAPFLMLTGLSAIALTHYPAAAQAETPGGAIETVHFRYVKPSDAVRNLQDGYFSFPQTGIAEMTPNDDDKTLILAGTEPSVRETTRLLRLLDVKPRQVQIKMRLIEVRTDSNGKTHETILLTPVITTANNQSAQVSVGEPKFRGMNLQITPTINGDRSITLLASLTERRLGKGAASARINTAGLSTYLRVPRQSEWKKCVMGSFGGVARSTAPDGKETIEGTDPLFRIEIQVTEKK